MRLCRFGQNQLGLVDGTDVIDVSEALGGLPKPEYPPLPHDVMIERLDDIRDHAQRLAPQARRIPLSEVRLLSPVGAPGKLVAAPVNYTRHLEEVREQADLNHNNLAHMREIREIGLFLKANSSLIGPSEDIALRFPDRRNDHEIELAVVIGRTADRVPASQALEHVAGYCIGLDMTVRGSEDRSFRKSLDTFSVLGPWLVTADELGEPGDLDFELSVNGDLRQAANTRDLVLSVPDLIEYASSFYTLHPGDVIFTGTPEGVAPVLPGDVITAKMARIGEFSIRVGGQ